MRVKATYRHVFEVTREVEIDDGDFAAWLTREAIHERSYSDEEDALTIWLNAEETEFHAEVLSDWRTDKPLPSDFELQYSEVISADREPSNSGSER